MQQTRSTTRKERVEHGPHLEPPVHPKPFLDRDLTVYREGTRWNFVSDKILMNGQDVHEIVASDLPDMTYWMGLAEGLNDYRKKVVAAARHNDQFKRFDSVMDAILGKVLGKLKRVYDQKMSGMSWTLQNGQLILNGINIRSFLALYRLRKTDKARKFLKSLRAKLHHLLENREESPDYERIRKNVEELTREIDAELAPEETAPSDRILLPARIGAA